MCNHDKKFTLALTYNGCIACEAERQTKRANQHEAQLVELSQYLKKAYKIETNSLIGERTGLYSIAAIVIDIMADTRSVIYHLDDGEYVIVNMYPKGRIILDFLDWEVLHKYLDKPDWFTKEYVVANSWIIEDYCSEGTEPGCWEWIPNYIGRLHK